jgi:hypothetical protein
MVIVSDATGTDGTGRAGLGVTYTRSFKSGNPLAMQWDKPRFDSDWRRTGWCTAVQTSFKSDSHVNVHEALGLLLAGRVGSSHGLAGHMEAAVILVDNLVVVGAASKGRSSSPDLNGMLRRWAGFLLQQGWVTPLLRYIPTSYYPADRPSRAFQ